MPRNDPKSPHPAPWPEPPSAPSDLWRDPVFSMAQRWIAVRNRLHLSTPPRLYHQKATTLRTVPSLRLGVASTRNSLETIHARTRRWLSGTKRSTMPIHRPGVMTTTAQALLERTDWTTRELRQAQTILIRTLDKEQYKQSWSMHNDKATAVAGINALLALLERFVRETRDGTSTVGLPKPRRVLKALLTAWKEAQLDGALKVAVKSKQQSKQTSKLMSPHDMWTTVQQLSTLLPDDLQPCIYMYNIMATVDIQQAPLYGRVPHEVAEQWLARIPTDGAPHRATVRPTVVTYNLVLSAWAHETLRTESLAARRIAALVQEMQHHGIGWNTATYRILLPFWTRVGHTDQVVTILDQMRDTETLDPELLLCATAVLTKYGHLIRAEDCVQQLLMARTTGSRAERRDSDRIEESVHHILNAYRRDFTRDSLNQYQRAEALECAEALVRRIQASGAVSTASMDRISSTLMDMFALAGNVHKARDIFANTKVPDAIQYGLLIKAYARKNNMDQATKLLLQVLQNSNVTPNITMFTTLVEAWAVSTRFDAVDQAFAVLRLVREHPRCVEKNIRPNNFFFTALLKCLAASKAHNAGERAESVLDEMERAATDSSGENLPCRGPDGITFSIAIKTCFEAGDLDRADAIMKRMERSSTPPNTRTYNTILQFYARLGTSAGVQRAEQIIKYMKDLSRTNASVEPNVVSYNIVLAGWSRSGAPDAAERMWSLYGQMLAESIDPSMASYSTIVSFFSKSDDKAFLTNADRILQDMIDRHDLEFRPDFRHFNPVLNGFLQIDDAFNSTKTLVRYIEVYLCSNNEYTKPNRGYFPRVAKAWIKAGDLVSATVFLEKIQDLHDSMHLPEGPCRESYKVLVTAWDKSGHPDRNHYTTRLETKLASFARSSQ